MSDSGPGRRRVVALHGFAGTGADWAAVTPLLDAEVLAPDLPGHGATAPPPRSGGFAATVQDLAAFARARGFALADWIGYSMGGRLALALAAARPEVVRTLVLIGASPGIADAAERAARRAADETWARLLESEGLATFFPRWDAQPLFAGRPSRRALPPHDPRALAAALRALGPGAQEPLHDRLARVDCPVLLLAGERDARYLALARVMAAALPHVTVGIIPHAGHTAHAEAPEEVATQVRAFWRT